VIATGFGTRQPRRRRQEPVLATSTPGAAPIPAREPESLSDSDLEIPSFLRED